MSEPLALIDVVNRISLTACTDEKHRIHYRQGSEMRSLTLAELDRRATRISRRLHALGVGPGVRVGVLAGNRIGWPLVDLAVIKLGGVTAAVEPGRFTPEYVIEKYGLRLLIIEEEAAESAAAAGAGAGSDAADGPAPDRVLAMSDVLAWAERDDPQAPVPPPHRGYDPADILSIKQTSGSTGEPKGIEATVASVNSSITAVQGMFEHTDGDNVMVMMPFWFLQQRYWFYSALAFGHDFTLITMDALWAAAPVVRPTVLMGVPGVYERIRARLREPGVDERDPAARATAIQRLLGGRVRYLWTGSAPADRSVLEYFNGAGVPLYEGYGLNETCIVAKNHPGAFRLGSVGKVLPGKSIRFDKDGVLIVGARHPVNTRYTWAEPGQSEKYFLPTGEVKTYDVGRVDEDGFLYIDGRVDDIITVADGYNVLATLIEERLRELPGVRDAAVFGTGRRFLTAVLCPSTPEADPALLGKRLAELNAGLREQQRIHAAILAPHPFSIANGMLNAQYKPMRKVIERAFAADLERFYARHARPADPPLSGAPLILAATGGPADEPQGARTP